MKERYLYSHIEDLCFNAHKMAFISGPRQCGKTTLGNMMLANRAHGSYLNWDDVNFRRAWAMNPSSILPAKNGKSVPLLVLDEIHKERFWKRNLKGVYDTMTSPCDILVTGSSRLNIYMKGSDSLLGRYYNFRLHPFSMRELDMPNVEDPDTTLERIFSMSPKFNRQHRSNLKDLMQLGPFPEPLFTGSERKANLWQKTRNQLIFRGDMRDLSRLPDIGRIEMLMALVPERVGAPFSLAAMSGDLECRFDTLKRWLSWLEQLYVIFEIKPYSRKIPRALKREGKIYLWNYGEVPGAPARFENLVACHLLKACHFWTDTGYGDFNLWYLRNKEKQEIDFLITRDKEPWLPVEVKTGDTEPSPNWGKFASVLPCKRGIQLVDAPVWKEHRFKDSSVLVADAAEALANFI